MADVAVHRVVIVGGGFGGLFAAKFLRRAAVEVTLIDARTTTCSSRCSTSWRPASSPRARWRRRSATSCAATRT